MLFLALYHYVLSRVLVTHKMKDFEDTVEKLENAGYQHLYSPENLFLWV